MESVADRTKSIIGVSTSRLLLDTPIATKKQGASQIEQIVRKYLHRDVRSAQDAIGKLIQLLEQHFLGIEYISPRKFKRIAGIKPNQVVGGMIGLTGVYSAAVQWCDRVLDSFYFIHSESSNFSCLFYASECIYNVILFGDEHNVMLDFNLLFSTLSRLCSLTAPETRGVTLELTTKELGALNLALPSIDAAIRKIATKQRIDVRKLIFDDVGVCVKLDASWLHIVAKNNLDHGISNLNRLLTVYLTFGLRGEEAVKGPCVELGSLLAQELANSKPYGDAVCEEIISFWLQHSEHSYLRTKVIDNLLEGLRTHEAAPHRSMTSFTCSLLVAPNIGDVAAKIQFPIECWFDIWAKHPELKLTLAAWFSITEELKLFESPPAKYLDFLTRFLIREISLWPESGQTIEDGFFAQLITNIVESKWMKNDETAFWTALAGHVEPETLPGCINVLSWVAAGWPLLKCIDCIVNNTAKFSGDVLQFYIFLMIGVQDPRLMAEAASEDQLEKVDMSAVLLEAFTPPVSKKIYIQGASAHDLIDWLEAIILVLEWPEALNFRLNLATDSNFYSMAHRALPIASPVSAIAQIRARNSNQSQPLKYFCFEVTDLSKAFSHTGLKRYEILSKIKHASQSPNTANDPLVTLPDPLTTLPEVPSNSGIVREHLHTPRTQKVRAKPIQPAESVPATAIDTAMDTNDAAQASPVGGADVDVGKAQEPEIKPQLNNCKQSGNRSLDHEDEEHNY